MTFIEEPFQVMTPVDSKTCPKLWEEKRWSLDRSLKDWTGCHGGNPSSYVQSSVVKIILVPFLFFRVCCPLSVALIFVVFLPICLFSFVISSVLRFHGLLGDRFFLVCFKSSKLQCFFLFETGFAWISHGFVGPGRQQLRVGAGQTAQRHHGSASHETVLSDKNEAKIAFCKNI